ncbi:MAG: AbrB/MazE/SpoVT family DNA-binding domain-containing protein, partial [Desulfobacterales bacterium]
MRVTTKGQVTIPQHIREKLGIVPATDIEFVEEKDRVYIVKKEGPENRNKKFRRLRGAA